MENIRKNIGNFFELTRAYSLLVSISAWFVALMWAVGPSVHIKDVILTFFGVVCVHLGANLFDDYIDVKRELDSGKALQEIDFGSVSQKARLIKDGTFPINTVIRIIASLFAIAMLVGIYYTIVCGLQIAVIALVAGVLCILYPFATKYYLGELSVALIFGPLLMSGTFIALTGEFYPPILAMSVSVGILTAVLLYAHSLMDWEFDEKRGKNTLCRFFKTKPEAIKALGWLIGLSYVNIVFFVLCGILKPNCLFVFLTLPIAVELIRSLKDYINIKDVKFEPKWWMGPMEDWEKIKQNHIEFFMYRFYLARNLCFVFSILGAICNYLR